MKPNVAHLLLCFSLLNLLCGCGSSPRDRLVGRWHGRVQFDDEAVEDKLGEANNPITKAVVEKLVTAAESGTMDCELKGDGEFTLTMELGPLSQDTYGQWEVVRQDAKEVTIRFTDPKGNIQDRTFKFLDDDTFTIDAPGKLKGLAVFKCTRVP
ncbi:MAG: hypothetical protein ACQESR_20875 [Planctomycetota bacterium]